MRIASSVLDLIGSTPLVRLNAVNRSEVPIVAKVEYLNPGGSIKDRIAVRIVHAAEASGELRPGGTIVEPTSGNTGVGLALVAQQRGYRCVFVVPDKVAEDKRAVLRAYGAEVVVAPTAVAPEDPRSYYSVSDRLVRETPGAFKPNQYANPAGPASHAASTGPEIWEATDGRITHLVAGVGTGGTITGTARFLKEASGGSVQVIGADPVGSIYSGGTGRPYLVEGVGEDFWPGAYDPSLVDEVIAVSDGDSFRMTRRLAREEGLLVGGSSGMATVAAVRLASRLGPDDLVVVLLPDGGRGYLGKVFDDDWMRRRGFLGTAGVGSVGELVRRKDVGGLADAGSLPAVRRDATVGEAIDVLRRRGGSRLLVLSAPQPVVLGEIAGTLDAHRLLAAAPGDSIEALIGPMPAFVGAAEPVAAARATLTAEESVLVLDDGRPLDLLTRTDLLAHASDDHEGTAP
ncbi:cystathionine beta-synthase [uncultured Amnibacterium sp.]|uniref:cystathionine beta-synthase n=1 Tax=uncultured Amnibacterium sp. TaxID=1631851 RepID=UPI0035C9FD88